MKEKDLKNLVKGLSKKVELLESEINLAKELFEAILEEERLSMDASELIIQFLDKTKN